MERRSHNRSPLDFAATALALDPGHFGQIHDLRMLDYGRGGMAALGSEPIEPGAIVTLGFAHFGYTAKRGTVVTCELLGNDYRIAVCFDDRLAA